MKNWILWSLIILNLVGLILMASDKYKASHKRWRIPEKVLFGTAALGGSIGIYCGCWLFRHKTKHNSFMVGIPVIMILQIILVFYMFSKRHLTL